MLHYQELLYENPQLKGGTLSDFIIFFFFFFLSDFKPSNLFTGTPSHSCEEMLEEVFSSRPDLRDIPLSQPGETYYTDRTGYLEQGHRKTGYAVTDAVVKAGRLPHTGRLSRALGAHTGPRNWLKVRR